ncbi:hypothetical protein [Thiolapillus brandeum]|uniref:CHAD domain-containing protein n=1 Tax=Thiolapillus brandeum TaxID=1076588 RepID=A0A7U6JIG0_9GAMM|nr:hypothetical protein [Thiolapillus brandeum]BAO44200.1 conserved hypothetical protein [Thiolapillus brandeum]
MEPLTSSTLESLFNHGSRWLANLRRAKSARKRESVKALRQVILAARETAVYIRKLNDSDERDHDIERHLSLLWTEPGFCLEDLELKKLAKRCQIKGKHWADPGHYERSNIWQGKCWWN